ncbi:PTS sugar transporter subunit IIB [Shouchella clausii]|uniref:PTS sugar transporter subunit IIB n=1 Tax=Shouchella clausii TaxID=79880 RepID=A0A268S2D6_SHOCL|nr:PTS sugar transporter subunit IIB [Shouchella clausii]PAD41828.1 PTS sugar transporter subunit IIB [Bacillus sp. 7520-S]MBU8598227.1 PTS sugar transporter subunit IIB [Shouchella clausii]MEB5479483.1 PTS sugar transporter subunit IIB [Shouchella clausii]MED4158012.1 PTS sugar transporter subunit IIB [Shouchella clausii]MED4176319.1 PTS sugar transporter subunit IIB [Shouchella clausii]
MTKVLLICGAGASSGFMANAIRKAGKKRGMEMSVQARSESQLSEYLNEIDVLLVGPHLKYMEDELREKVSGYSIKVSVIPQSIYGTLDGNKACDLIANILESGE